MFRIFNPSYPDQSRDIHVFLDEVLKILSRNEAAFFENQTNFFFKYEFLFPFSFEQKKMVENWFYGGYGCRSKNP